MLYLFQLFQSLFNLDRRLFYIVIYSVEYCPLKNQIKIAKINILTTLSDLEHLMDGIVGSITNLS